MQEIRTPMKAIRAKCLDCSCNQRDEIKYCPVDKCPLYPFRLGKNPYLKKREYTEEQKAQMLERLARGKENA